VLASIRELPLPAGDGVAKVAMDGRCKAILIIATNSEAVHDSVDSLIEAQGATDVLTTFHTGRDGLSDVLSLLDARIGGDGPVWAFSDPPEFVEAGLRDMGLLA